MPAFAERIPQLQRHVNRLHAALLRSNEAEFRDGVALLVAEHDPDNRQELRDLTLRLQHALDEFRSNSRLATLAAQDVPDARYRLEHVLKLTDDAAHRTLDLVEQSVPLAEGLSRESHRLAQLPSTELTADHCAGFVVAVRRDLDALRANLTEVLLAQGYQDLSGQILRGVMKLVGELELTLSRLLLLSGCTPPSPAIVSSNTLQGPAIPGRSPPNAVGKQQDVDDLLSGLGI